MIDYFQICSSTKVYFGTDCVGNALNSEKEIIGERPLIVSTGNSLKKLGYLDELKSMLNSDALVCNQISANPDVDEVRDAIRIGKENNVTSVIGFGGGSAIDAAKATAVGVVSDIDIEEYLIKGIKLPERTIPIIAIPTTAGTGAELSKGAILSSRKYKIKQGIRGDSIIPSVAIVNPSYTYTIPRNITIETGFDVFAHAAESYCSVSSNIFSDMLSEKAIKIVGDALPKLSMDLMDIEARMQMSFASHIMGYNVKNVGNCLPHRMQYPVGVETDTSHGAGLIALYPKWVKYESQVNAEKIRNVLDWLGAPKADNPEDRISKWLDNIQARRSLSDLGVKSDAPVLAEKVTGKLDNDLLAKEDKIIERIYMESM